MCTSGQLSCIFHCLPQITWKLPPFGLFYSPNTTLLLILHLCWSPHNCLEIHVLQPLTLFSTYAGKRDIFLTRPSHKSFFCVEPYHHCMPIQRLVSMTRNFLLPPHIIWEDGPYWWPLIWCQGQKFFVACWWVTPSYFSISPFPFHPLITSLIT